MRADAPALTWLLGGAALWALAVWVLGLSGLGGRIDRLPPDPALVQGLPAVAQPDEERLAPLAEYSEFAERPLFMPDRRPQPFFLDPADGDAPTGFDFVLTSVLLVPGLEIAILQPAGGGESVRLKVGEAPEAAPGWQLASVTPRGAVFAGPEGQRSLELRVFDGVGGESPTVMSTPMAPPARPGDGMDRPAQDAQAPAGSSDSAISSADSPPAAAEAGRRKPGAPPAAADMAGPASVSTPDEQVEAIRARIEARRARMREQE